MRRLTTRLARASLLMVLAFCPDGVGHAAGPSDEVPAGLEPIGGRWYVRKGDRPTYFYRDGDTYVDLFSYHTRDSNKDGIDNIRVRHDGRFLLIDSQGYPNHPTAIFPNSRNPNRIRVQDFHFKLPLEPRRGESITRVPMGPIGMALNGVVFFNPFEAGGMNAIEGYSEVWLDSCCGHPQQTGVYHYHKFPSCVKTPFPDEGRGHSPVIGFAFDGYPLHGPYEEAGLMARDLQGRPRPRRLQRPQRPEARISLPCDPGPVPLPDRRLRGDPGARQQPDDRADARRGDRRQRRGHRPPRRRDPVGHAGHGRTRPDAYDPDRARCRGPGIPDGKAEPGSSSARSKPSKIDRQGDTVLAEIAIPKDASLGVLLDGHVEFGRPRAAAVSRSSRKTMCSASLIEPAGEGGP